MKWHAIARERLDQCLNMKQTHAINEEIVSIRNRRTCFSFLFPPNMLLIMFTPVLRTLVTIPVVPDATSGGTITESRKVLSDSSASSFRAVSETQNSQYNRF